MDTESAEQTSQSVPVARVDRGASTSPRRVVLITGAARRLGRAMALHLARTHWDVGVHCNHSVDEANSLVRELQHLGVRAVVLPADLSQEADCEALLPAAVAALGRVDAVVNNASRFEYDNIDTVSFERMAAHWQANTAPALILSRALHRHVQSRKGQGCVVNLLDQKLWNLNPDYLSYTLSKAALESANTLLAQALAPHVRVVGVAPGAVLTHELLDEAALERVHRQSLLAYGPSVDHVVDTVAFVLGNAAITGTTVLVDAGAHLQKEARDVSFLT